MKLFCKLGFHKWETKERRFKVWNPSKKRYDSKLVPYRTCHRCGEKQIKTIYPGGTITKGWKKTLK
jgi:hypothetical protein